MTPAPAILAYAVEPQTGRRLRVAALLASLYPAAPLVSLYLSGIATWLTLGHWPQVCVDKAGVPALDSLTRWLVIGSLPAAAANAALSFLAWVWAGRCATRRNAAHFVVLPLLTWGAALAILWWDPASLWSWMLD